MHIKRLKAMAALFSFNAMAAGCTTNVGSQDGQRLEGMANPASVHCITKGGKSFIAKDKDGGEYGVCHLPDGTKIEEWELFRRDNRGAGE